MSESKDAAMIMEVLAELSDYHRQQLEATRRDVQRLNERCAALSETANDVAARLALGVCPACHHPLRDGHYPSFHKITEEQAIECHDCACVNFAMPEASSGL